MLPKPTDMVAIPILLTMVILILCSMVLAEIHVEDGSVVYSLQTAGYLVFMMVEILVVWLTDVGQTWYLVTIPGAVIMTIAVFYNFLRMIFGFLRSSRLFFE